MATPSSLSLISSLLEICCIVHSSLERERGEGGVAIVVVDVALGTVNCELLGIVSSNKRKTKNLKNLK